MNLEVTAVTNAPIARPDASDAMALVLLGAGFIASWTYAFLFPSPTVFGLCIGATGAWTCAYHAIAVHDDKVPDRKEG